MVKLEVGLLYEYLHRHHDEITFKTMGLCSLYLSNWQSYPRVSPACCSIDMVCYVYRGNVLKCPNHNCIFFPEMSFPLYLTPFIMAKLQMRYIFDAPLFPLLQYLVLPRNPASDKNRRKPSEDH